ncbi:MAG TPA: tRNA 2-thiouridine(34) synthase MnmA [Candidatus Paceibacterota bacterium]|nr:tRNA 2-thiouridine(34) synthase MnmA [Candidatus Paceibacterota bacterium]
MDLRGKKVSVGLSGGVDSAVTAALLKEAGARVVGVFIKGWYPPGMPCTWSQDRRDAMRVAARLGIPFQTLDASIEYKRGVIDYLLDEYRRGRTPNPDIMCNREVKFGAFARYAQGQDADFIATGHYARQEGGQLLRGVDEGKDQSYFLWAIPQEALAMALFPLGTLHKDETRRLAQRFALPNAQKKDSQGICFLGQVSVEDFLKEKFGEAPGAAFDEEGKEIGTHNGALLHTIGERIHLENALPGPWYVVRKDAEANALTVSRSRAERRSEATIGIRQANWLSEPIPDEMLSAQYRYHGPKVAGKLSADRSSFIPAAPLAEALASGQSLVLYRGERCIGGGIIV